MKINQSYVTMCRLKNKLISKLIFIYEEYQKAKHIDKTCWKDHFEHFL